jgi:hypothetical protein
VNTVADIIEAVKHLSRTEKDEVFGRLREIEFQVSSPQQLSSDAVLFKSVLKLLFVSVVVLTLYIGSYAVASRVTATKGYMPGGRVTFTFCPGSFDTEYTLTILYAPLIVIDEMETGRVHRFEMQYVSLDVHSPLRNSARL